MFESVRALHGGSGAEIKKNARVARERKHSSEFLSRNKSNAGMAATFRVAAPGPFNFSRPEEWTKWIRRFERFRKASGLDAKEDEAQVNTLIYP